MTTDDLVEAARRFERSVEGGDLGAAAAAAERIDEESGRPRSLVDALATAVEEDADGRARLVFGALVDAYEASEAEEEERAVQATALGSVAGAAVSRQQAATRYLSTAMRVTLERVRFLTRSGVVVSPGPTPAGARRDVVDGAERVREREAALNAATGRVIGAARDTDLGPLVAVSAVRLDGRVLTVDAEGTVTVTVANVGTEPVGGLDLRVDTPDGLSVSSATLPTDGLVPGDRADAEVAVTGTATGDHTLRATVVGDGVRSATGRETMPVRDRLPLPVAVDRDGDGRIDTDELQRAVAHWDDEEPVPGTDGVVPTTDDLRRLLVTWSRGLPVR